MFGTNMVILVGTLGRKPDGVEFENGSEVSNFTIATTDPISRETIWHKIVAKGALGNLCNNNNLDKGSVVSIVGHLYNRKFIDKITQQERLVTEVIAHRVDFLTPHSDNATNQFNDQAQSNQHSYQDNQHGYQGHQQLRSPFKNRNINQGSQNRGQNQGFQNRGQNQGFQNHSQNQRFQNSNHNNYSNGFGNYQNTHNQRQSWNNEHDAHEREFHNSQPK